MRADRRQPCTPLNLIAEYAIRYERPVVREAPPPDERLGRPPGDARYEPVRVKEAA